MYYWFYQVLCMSIITGAAVVILVKETTRIKYNWKMVAAGHMVMPFFAYGIFIKNIPFEKVLSIFGVLVVASILGFGYDYVRAKYKVAILGAPFLFFLFIGLVNQVFRKISMNDSILLIGSILIINILYRISLRKKSIKMPYFANIILLAAFSFVYLTFNGNIHPHQRQYIAIEANSDEEFYQELMEEISKGDELQIPGFNDMRQGEGVVVYTGDELERLLEESDEKGAIIKEEVIAEEEIEVEQTQAEETQLEETQAEETQVEETIEINYEVPVVESSSLTSPPKVSTDYGELLVTNSDLLDRVNQIELPYKVQSIYKSYLDEWIYVYDSSEFVVLAYINESGEKFMLMYIDMENGQHAQVNNYGDPGVNPLVELRAHTLNDQSTTYIIIQRKNYTEVFDLSGKWINLELGQHAYIAEEIESIILP